MFRIAFNHIYFKNSLKVCLPNFLQLIKAKPNNSLAPKQHQLPKERNQRNVFIYLKEKSRSRSRSEDISIFFINNETFWCFTCDAFETFSCFFMTNLIWQIHLTWKRRENFNMYKFQSLEETQFVSFCPKVVQNWGVISQPCLPPPAIKGTRYVPRVLEK